MMKRFPTIICLLILVGNCTWLPAQEVVMGPFEKREILIPDSGEVRLIAYPENAAYQWSSGWKTPVIFVKDSGWVWVDVNVNGQVRRDSIYLRLPIPCVELPSVLSPNAEVVNDCLLPRINCELESFELTIYNRWGEKIFATTDTKSCWDGSREGKSMPEGVYYYVLKWKEPESMERTKTGNVTLLR